VGVLEDWFVGHHFLAIIDKAFRLGFVTNPAFHPSPAEIHPLRSSTGPGQLLPLPLTDIANVEIPSQFVERELPRIPESVVEYLLFRTRHVDERVVGWDHILRRKAWDDGGLDP